MKLYDFMKISQNDYDTEDTVYCATVTVCYIDEEYETEDNYYKFCTEIIKKVEVEKQVGDTLLVKWTELIQNNMEKFKEFTAKHWKYKYEDDEDEFIYQWIKEIHYYLAGYVAEKFYDKLVEFVKTLEA